jgi:predicted MFS family arabinose efflux permease
MPPVNSKAEEPSQIKPKGPVSTGAPHPKPHAPLPFLGLACAVGVSTIYYNQPLLLEMARSYGTTIEHTGFVAVATQVGYAFGLLLFVPLGDLLERRALMMRMFAAVAVSLLLVALAPNFALLVAGSALIGLLASVTHIVLPIAPDLVDDASRGRAIGIVMTGLLLGILLARTFAGWVANIHGWRYVFVTAAVINAAFVPLLWKMMPKLPPKQNLRYSTAMRSLWTLFRTQPLLRESSVLGALVFASFSCFWTTLAALLETHYGLGAGVAGTFGIVGAAGAMVAPIAGRLADRKGSRWVICGLCSALGRRAGADIHAAAHRRVDRRRRGARYGRADDADLQPDADLRPGAVGAQPPEHGVYDDLLCGRGGWLGAGNDLLGTLALEWRVRAGIGTDRAGHHATRNRAARWNAGRTQPGPRRDRSKLPRSLKRGW